MKKFLCFSSLAALLGCLNSGVAFGQYPGAYGSMAPSAYPVQYQQPQNGLQLNMPQVPNNYQMMPVAPPAAFNAQQPVSHGWVGPQSGQYQFATMQVPPAELVPTPLAQPMTNVPSTVYPQQNALPPSNSIMEQSAQPMQTVPSNGSNQTYGQTPVYQGAPAYNSTLGPSLVYGQTVAPGCTSCSAAPVSESYGYAMAGGYFGQGHGGHFRGRAAGCGGCLSLPPCAKPYFGGAGVLLFFRDDDTNRALDYDVGMPTMNLLGTSDASTGVMPGFEVFVGRYFNCGRNALSIGYWGLFPDTETATTTTAGGNDLRSRVPFAGPGTTSLEMPALGAYPQESVYQWYDDAQAHQVVRNSNYHNLEANWLGFGIGGAARSFYLPTAGSLFSGTRGARHHGGCGYCGGSGCNACGGCYADCGTCPPPTKFATGPCCLTPGCGSCCNLTWLGGIRYFQFTDDLSYGASRADTSFGGGNDDIYYDTNVSNDLVGFQFGGMMNYCCGKCINLYGLGKLGAYYNHAELTTRIGTANTLAYVNSMNQYNGMGYIVSSTKNDVAFIGEMGTGINFRLTSKWSGNVGYRGIVAAGVATAPAQIPFEMTHLGNVADFNNDCTLILHGLNIGGLYNF